MNKKNTLKSEENSGIIEGVSTFTPNQMEVSEDENKEAVIYIGQSLSSGILQQYSVFNNGIPAHLDPYIEKCPAIKQLIIPISKLAEAKNSLLVTGSRENVLNQQIQTYVRGGY